MSALPKLSKKDFARIYGEAREAGLKALRGCETSPMVVTEYANPLYGLLPGQNPGEVKNRWVVEGGPCGFAWIQIYRGGSFANWLKAQGYARKNTVGGGVIVNVIDGGQSIQRKEAFAEAFAKVLQSYGIEAYAESRLD